MVLLKDDSIRRRPAELAALRAAGVKAFCITNANLTGEEYATRLVTNRHRIIQRCRHPGPFIDGVYENKLRRLWPDCRPINPGQGAVAPGDAGGPFLRLAALWSVLTIRAAKSPGYYERAEFARDDYYAEGGEAPGRWVGRGAATLGLEGAPDRGQLEVLLDGQHPESGEPLPGLRFRRTNAGFDLTFTAPKAMSVLAAVGEDDVRDAVIAAHEAGVAAGLDYLERHECEARRGAGGLRIIPADGFVGARYGHELSRAGDPHLHTHVVIANAARGADGRFSAPDMRPVFAAAKTAGTIAEAVARRELTRSLGVAWGAVTNGTAEIAGIRREVLEHFSTRHAEIEELAAIRGADGLRAVGALQRETRDHKPLVDREAARTDWRARAAEHGLSEEAIADLLGRRVAIDPRPQRIATLNEQLAGPTGLTQQESTFRRRDVIRAFAEAHRQGLDARRLEELADDFLTQEAMVVEPEDSERGWRERYTTPDLLAAERRLLAVAEERAPRTAADPASVEAALAARPWLGEDQVRAVRHLTGGQDRVRLLEAGAGRGKTAALAAVADAYRASHVTVVGLAWQGEAAQTLERETGIRSYTAARLLRLVGRGTQPFPAGAVAVVDEAATMPTRALSNLAEAVAHRNGRLLLVGDRAQLPSIDAGGAFAALVDRLGAAELNENRRQRDPMQREVADLLGNGRASDALRLLESGGRLTAVGSLEDARAHLIEDWSRAALPNPAQALILAHDRADVAALNSAARAAMDRAGILGPERLVAHGREWAAGDRLVCRRNDYRPEVNVRNGTRGAVVVVDTDFQAIVLRTDEGRVVQLPPDYLEHVHHGYAITGHASQGATVNRTFVLAGPERGSTEWAYVAGSRHRIDLRVYVAQDATVDAVAALGRAWSRSQAKQLATDRIETMPDGALSITPPPRFRDRELEI